MTVTEFVDNLSAICLPNVFNPYRDSCPTYDHQESTAIRRQNLTLFLDAMVNIGVPTLWLGRDLGYRGGRRTGIALTDEHHLQLLSETFGIVGLTKATVDTDFIKERTATEVWKALSRINQPVMLWNVFPFHPYESPDPFTNRRHTKYEFDFCSEILVQLISWLQPTEVVALGADAETAVGRLGLRCTKVRHPSYGGQTQFAAEIHQIYRIGQHVYA